jgi:galactose oxidase
MFCPGTALLSDGSVLVVGGVISGLTNMYNSSWRKAPKLNVRRGYNAAVTLSNGNVFTLGGSWSGGMGGKSGEIWTPATGWRVLPAVQPYPFLTNDTAGVYRPVQPQPLHDERRRKFHPGHPLPPPGVSQFG